MDNPAQRVNQPPIHGIVIGHSCGGRTALGTDVILASSSSKKLSSIRGAMTRTFESPRTMDRSHLGAELRRR